jgi:DNA-binding GntR family transcriptional regulator
MYNVVIEKARVDIYSHQVPTKYAKDLVVKEGSSALVVTRTYTGDQNEVFQITVSSHPEDRYRYSFELKREVRLVRPLVKK